MNLRILPVKDPAGAYLAADLATASPARLAVLFYDRCSRLCWQAVGELDAGDPAAAGRTLAKARQILQHLAELSAGPQFSRVFDHLLRLLIEADFYRRRESVLDVVAALSDHRSRWQNAFPRATPPNAAARKTAGWIG